MKFIQGFFVQYSTAWVERLGEPMIQKALFSYMYAGTIYPDESGALVGQMMDAQGESRLYDVEINETEVRFKKEYLRYRDKPLNYVNYHFDRREENTWVGKWYWPDYDDPTWSPSRCVITDVDEGLFQYDVAHFLKTSFPSNVFDQEKLEVYLAKYDRPSR